MLFSPLASQSARHPNADLVMVEGMLDPAEPGERLLVAPYHVHRVDEELFYVLSGHIGFDVGDETFTASAGDAVMVPPGAAHSWWNAADTPARYLIVMPKKLDDLIIAIHARHREPAEMVALYDTHDTTYIGWTR